MAFDKFTLLVQSPMICFSKTSTLFVLMALIITGCQQATEPTAALDASQAQASSYTSDASTSAHEVRRFEFDYHVVITEVPPGKSARIWIPIATSNHDQKVDIVKIQVPGEHRKTVDSSREISLLYLEAKGDAKGQIPISIKYTVERHELTSTHSERVDVSAAPGAFLAASTLVPVDGSILRQIVGDEASEQDELQITVAGQKIPRA